MKVNILPFIFFLIFGIIIGSFLNVVLFRFNTGRTVGGRSKCFSCRRELQPIDLVPVLSFLAFKGRCRTCKSRISWQYPLVEMLTGALFACTYLRFAPEFLMNPNRFLVDMVFGCVFMSLLVLITVYDLKHKIIPDMFVFLLAASALIYACIGVDAFGTLFFSVPSLHLLLAGPLLALPFYFLWLVSAGTWMGFGDAKLALAIGWLLGMVKGGVAIMLGFYIGAVLSICVLLVNWISGRIRSARSSKASGSSGLSMKSEIPFAPFLIAGLLIVYFFGYTVVCVAAPMFCGSFFSL